MASELYKHGPEQPLLRNSCSSLLEHQGWLLVAQRVHGLLFGYQECLGMSPPHSAESPQSSCSHQALPRADFVFVALGEAPGRDFAVVAEQGWGICGSWAVRWELDRLDCSTLTQSVFAAFHFQNEIPVP